LAELVSGGHTLATAAIHIGEVNSGMRPDEQAKTESFFSSLEFYPMTAAIARRAESLKYAWGTKGKTLSVADMIVAATAL
jgi:predicted nucleic acid-binding protein